MINKKEVILKIEVPNTQYCWDGLNLCEHFDNEGGHGSCDLNIGLPEYLDGKYEKPKECIDLVGFE